MRVLVASCTFCALTALFPAPAAATAVGDADTAALQVALRAAGAYLGTIDGLRGPDTEDALVSFQERVGLAPDGIAGPRTRRALGDLGAPDLGSRPLTIGARGWDVAELQFKLAWHGFPSGPFDGAFGPRLDAALRRFQRFADLPGIGVAGSRTMAALARPLPTSPLDLSAPVAGPVGDAFGPRGGAFHAGVDFVASAGTPVVSARAGRVVWAAALGSFGNTVVVRHGSGVRTLYAHLSRIDVGLLERVSTGTGLGLVGSTGRSTGPHLHFEVRVRGAAVRPAQRVGLAETLVEAVDEVGHALQALRDHAHSVLEEVLGLDAERLRQPREDVVRGHRPVAVHDVVEIAGGQARLCGEAPERHARLGHEPDRRLAEGPLAEPPPLGH